MVNLCETKIFQTSKESIKNGKTSISDKFSTFMTQNSTTTQRSRPPKILRALDIGTMSSAMEKGHKVYKFQMDNKWDKNEKTLKFDRETNQLILSNVSKNPLEKIPKQYMDIRQIVEAQTVSFKTARLGIEVDCLRGGYRSVPLLNQSSEPLELSALLVHVQIESIKPAGVKLLQPHLQLQAGRTVQQQAGQWQRNRSCSVPSVYTSTESPLQSPAFPADRRFSAIENGVYGGGSSNSSSSPYSKPPINKTHGRFFKTFKDFGKKITSFDRN